MARTDEQPIIELRRVTKQFPVPNGTVTVLDDVDLQVDRGVLTALVGPSGSGKSTLLGLVSGIDRVTRGQVIVGGAAVHELGERAMARWRGRTVGVVFQFFQLLPTLTAIENVMLPMDLCDVWSPAERRQRAADLLDRLGVADQADKLPATLSGGQQQRVAVARALANGPAVLLADEPTGNLDARNAAAILELFAGLAEDGQTVLMATHDAQVHRVARRSLHIADGDLTESGAVAHA